ncbi:MAG: hypothetical protein PHH61_00005 [Candidatus Nanoarchaeia archaeon]|nr:hypothetical protein [Candidatus Nanoarchaeia archaeon]
MTKGALSIDLESPIELEINENEIVGSGVISHPNLEIPISYRINPIMDILAPQGPQNRISIIHLDAELSINNISLSCYSRFQLTKKISSYTDKTKSGRIMLSAHLCYMDITTLEEQRKARDLKNLKLDIRALVEIERTAGIFTEIATGEVLLNIPQSHWVTKILNPWQYDKVKLIEIKFSEDSNNKLLQEGYNRLQTAKTAYTEGRSSDCVLWCYRAFEYMVKEKLGKPELRNISSANFQEFLNGIIQDVPDDHKRLRVGAMFGALCQFCHDDGRHEKPGYSLDHADAEFVLIQTQVLFQYLSKYFTTDSGK